jgi:hypothetical protein
MSTLPEYLLREAEVHTPVIGLYDAPDPAPFAPLIGPKHCIFDVYEQWEQGITLHLTRDNFGCAGCGNWIFNIPSRSREQFAHFLVDTEGLRASHAHINAWLDSVQGYSPKHDNILIGPLKEGQEEYLRTITFFLNPDQLSLFFTAACYESMPSDPPPVIAPFGSGCAHVLAFFEDLEVPQVMIGSTDMAMRHRLPRDLMTLTVTAPMFARFHNLDERSFLGKGFLRRLKQSRGALS